MNKSVHLINILKSIFKQSYAQIIKLKNKIFVYLINKPVLAFYALKSILKQTYIHIMKLKEKLFIYLWNKKRDLECTEYYWIWRQKYRLCKFYVNKSIFKFYHFLHDKISAASTINTIIYSGLRSLILAILSFLLIIAFENLVFLYLPNLHSIGVSFTERILKLFNSSINLDQQKYIDFMGGLSSVAGVFLGLYFTVISVGIGPHLDKLSPNLRKLIVTEKTGSRYVDLLTVFTALTFLLWFNASTFNAFSVFSLFVVLIYALVLISAFYPLGQKSFFLADPPSLAMPLIEKIHTTLRKLQKTDSLYGDESFQSYFRNTISYEISSIEEILVLALEKDAKGKTYVSHIVQNLFSELLFYITFKQMIPKDSLWFQRVSKHDDWLYQDETRISMLKSIGAITEPKQLPDHNWLEKKIQAIIIQAVRHYVKVGDADGIIEVLSKCRVSIIVPLAYGWNIDSAIGFYKDFQNEIFKFIFNKDVDFEKRLAITESFAIMGVDIVQQSLQRVTEQSWHLRFKELAKSIRAQKSLSTLDQWETPYVKRSYEELVTKIIFELQIERTVITPIWYIEQILAIESAKETKDLFEKLSTIVGDFQLPDTEKVDYQNAVICGLILQRQIEVISRIKSHQSYYTTYINNLKQYEKISDLKIEANLSIGTEKGELLLSKSYEQISDLLIPLFKTKRDDTVPDFFGIFYIQLIDQTYLLLKETNLQRIKPMFAKLLLAAMFAKERLSGEYENPSDSIAQFKISFDPVLDLMVLSGYAKLFSEMNDNALLFNFVVEAWGKTLKAMKIELDSTEWLVKCYQILRSDYRQTKAFARRFHWERQFHDLLREKEYITDNFNYHQEPKSVPPTPFLKVLCSGGHEPHEEMADVFLTALILESGNHNKLIKEFNSTFLYRVQRVLEKDQNKND